MEEQGNGCATDLVLAMGVIIIIIIMLIFLAGFFILIGPRLIIGW